MKLIIDIPKEAYELLQNDGVDWLGAEHIFNAVANGVLLPKVHGRLIDADEVIKIANKTKDLHGAIWNAPTIIEADKESEGK